MAHAGSSKSEMINDETGGMLFELPDASSYDGEAGSGLVQYEKMRNFGWRCRSFFPNSVKVILMVSGCNLMASGFQRNAKNCNVTQQS